MGFDLVSAAPSRNLVVVRAGDNSLHERLLPGAVAGWYDLVVSYFGADAERFRTAHENRIDVRGGKWDGLGRTLEEIGELPSRWDYCWLPDDDLDISPESIRDLFAAMRRHRLAVAQPALSHDSWFTFLQLLRCKSFELRWIDGIELMAPCFSIHVLEIVRPIFSQTSSGYGLDSLWCRLEPDNRKRSAVIDAIEMRHTRSVGGGQLYENMKARGLDPYTEMDRLLGRFDVEPTQFRVYGGLCRNGRPIGRLVATFAMIVNLILARSQTPMKRHYFNKLIRLVRQQITSRARLDAISENRFGIQEFTE